MKNFCPVFVVFLSLICCFVLTSCGQANSVPTPMASSTTESSPEPTPKPTPESIDYIALAARLNADIVSPLDEAEAKLEENADSSDVDLDREQIGNALVSGGVFEAGDDCVIYRFWSAGIDKALFDLLGSDETESSAVTYSELLNTFVANYDALQKAVHLYEEDAVLVLHVVENNEATDPIIVVENGEVTYDYGTAQGYFVSEKPVDNSPAEESTG